MTEYVSGEGEPMSAELIERQKRIDPEILNLVKAMNTTEGITTRESCCGHGIRPVQVWFQVDKVKDLYPLTRLTDTRYGGAWPKWVVEAIDTDTEVEGQPGVCGVHFLLSSSSIGPEAYEQGEALAERLNEFWGFAEKYGHDYGVRKREKEVDLESI